MKRKRSASKRPGPAFEPCAMCVNGWAVCAWKGTPSKYVRCPCWHAHQQRLADLEAAARTEKSKGSWCDHKPTDPAAGGG